MENKTYIKKNKKTRLLTCEFDIALSIIGGKWKLLLLWFLSADTPIRFGEFKKLIPINQKTLTNQLRELEEDGIVTRTIYPEIPPKVEYSLTPKGKTLLPIIKDLCKWGKENAEFDYELQYKVCEDKQEKN